MGQENNLEVHYKELKNTILNNKLKNEVQTLINNNNYKDHNVWLKALALCDFSHEHNCIDDNVNKLYSQIFRRNKHLYFSSGLPEKDYNFWFNLVINISDKFIEHGYFHAYAEKEYIIETSRRPHRNKELEKELLLKGIENNDPASIAIYGHSLYFGTRDGIENKEEGLYLIHRAKDMGYEFADNYLVNITFYNEEDNAKVLAVLEEFKASKNEEYEKAYHLLSEYYLYKEINFEKALDFLNRGIAVDNPYCMYLLGVNILNNRLELPKDEGVKMLENAYSYGVIHAANWLGRYYYYTLDEYKSLEKSMIWHEKAKLYYFEDSMVELALNYIYDDEVKDLEKGEIYLNWAIQEGSARAMSEKAHILLSEEQFDTEEVKNLLEQAIEKGDAYAPYRLGLLYEKGVYGEPDYYKAFELYKLSAERDHIFGIELTGHYYRIGISKPEEADPEKAIEFFNRAIERGSNYAKVELAFCYEVGFGVEKDYNIAYELFKTAADNGYTYAYNKTGYYEEDGLIGEQNLEKAFEFYKKAANSGNIEGIYNVGRAYKYGIGVHENPALAVENYKKAADLNYGDALIEIALAYENEYGGLDFDPQLAMEYMTRAAEMGYAYAQYKVGYYYYYGLTERNIELALEWLMKAYENNYPYASIILGDYYLYNDSKDETPQYDKAFEFYKTAEEEGVVSEGLGVCYEYGIGVEKNEFEAFKYYTMGAEAGYTNAKYRLGNAYKFGTGTDKNLEDAFKWLSEAAEEGNFQAKYSAAIMLLDGEGTQQNPEQGIDMLTQIANEGHADAQYELGNCYLMGKGVPEDEVQAMVWYQKAAEKGHEQALRITGKKE